MIPGFAISAGVSLLSGLFSRQSAAKQARKEEEAIREANRVATENAARMNLEVRARSDAAALVPHQTTRGVDMDAFMAAAEDYGFNPLTFLRSGALSSFEWACETGHGAMEAAQAGQYIPQLAPVLAQTKVPGLGEVFGNALTSGANQYLAEAGEQRAFQNQVTMMQLQGAQRAGAYSGLRFGTVPQSYEQSVTGARRSGGAELSKLPTMMMDILDNRPNSPTRGQVIQIVDPEYARQPESELINYQEPFRNAPLISSTGPMTSENAGRSIRSGWNSLVDYGKQVWFGTWAREVSVGGRNAR